MKTVTKNISVIIFPTRFTQARQSQSWMDTAFTFSLLEVYTLDLKNSQETKIQNFKEQYPKNKDSGKLVII